MEARRAQSHPAAPSVKSFQDRVANRAHSCAFRTFSELIGPKAIGGNTSSPGSHLEGVLPKSAQSKIQHPPRSRSRPPPRFIGYFDDDDEFQTHDSDQPAFGNTPLTLFLFGVSLSGGRRLLARRTASTAEPQTNFAAFLKNRVKLRPNPGLRPNFSGEFHSNPYRSREF
jgi:hypothetical protein